MGWLLLILVLLAAAFGVLGAVLKAAAFLVFTLVLTIVALVAIAYYYGRYRLRRMMRESDARMRDGQAPTSSSTIDVGEPGQLPRDDRY